MKGSVVVPGCFFNILIVFFISKIFTKVKKKVLKSYALQLFFLKLAGKCVIFIRQGKKWRVKLAQVVSPACAKYYETRYTQVKGYS